MTGVSLSEFTTTFKEDEINMGYMRYNGRAIFVHYIPAKVVGSNDRRATVEEHIRCYTPKNAHRY